MRYIEPHDHMVSRTTDDYERMALAGCESGRQRGGWGVAEKVKYTNLNGAVSI